jgi:hypothetical protein
MNYASSLDTTGKGQSHLLYPWKQKGLINYDTISEVPDDCILVVPHFAPWCEPLKSYIQSGRPYIEIEYGYWGLGNTMNKPRRVTYNNFHNLNYNRFITDRTTLFNQPEILPYKNNPDGDVLVILPHRKTCWLRTGLKIQHYEKKITTQIRKFYSGNLTFRYKQKGSNGRWESFLEDLQGIKAVIGERTVACAEANLLGIPAYSVDNSITTLLTGELKNINNITFPDRSKWFQHICHSQFLVEEFQTTTPADITEIYQIL